MIYFRMKSVVDGMELDGIKSIRIHSGTDYMGDTKLIRWTEVFLIQTDEDENCARYVLVKLYCNIVKSSLFYNASIFQDRAHKY